MRRREFLGLFGGLSATIISGAARGDAIKRVALVVLAAPIAEMQETSTSVYARTFFAELRRLGYVEGKNLIVLRFTSAGHVERIPDVAREVVAATPDVILAFSSRIVLQLEKETTSIPIVFVIADDPVASGIVASLSRPGGNATGLTSLNAAVDAKRLELLKEAMPALRRVALLTSRGDPATSSTASATQNAARSLGVELEIQNVESMDNLEGMLTAVVKAGSEAVIVAGSPVFFPLQPRIAQWSEAARTPVISPWRELPEAGGLLSYGTSVSGMFRRAAVFVDHILKGEEHPATFPVEQPTTFELVVNIKTAKALGLTIPPPLLARADEVIE